MSAPERPTSWWPDGSPRSTDNGFTLCHDGKPHGFVRRAASTAPTRLPPSNRYDRAFGGLNGVIPGMGRD